MNLYIGRLKHKTKQKIHAIARLFGVILSSLTNVDLGRSVQIYTNIGVEESRKRRGTMSAD